MLRRLIPSGPSLPGLVLSLACTLCFCPGTAAQKTDSWTELKSAHFIVYSDGGEKAASKVALQFEQIRDVFTKLSKNLRVDPGQPIVILAAKDEKSLAALLPEFYGDKNRVHPAGIFFARPEQNYIVLRANVDSDLPFATLYHEYTHQITNLNAAFVPTWFSEGYADFFGYSRIAGGRVSIGLASEGDLYFLQQTKLMPLADLFRVDHKSPYYNESKKANIFYAESWALVHMLFMSQEFRNSDRMGSYLRNVNSGMDPLESANRAFGDLAALQKKLEAYIRAGSYYHYDLVSPVAEISKSFAARTPSEAEGDAVLGTYQLMHGQKVEGRKLLEQSARLEPDLVAANEGLGMMHIEDKEPEQAAPYLDKAVGLNSKSFLTYFYHANLLLESGPSNESVMSAAADSYKKCISLNANFAPAYAALAQIYGQKDETLDQALQAARTAVALEPANWGNQLALAVTLARRGQFGDARALADRVAASATEPTEADSALSALTYIGALEQREANVRRYNEQLGGAPTATIPAKDTVLARRPGAGNNVPPDAPSEGSTSKAGATPSGTTGATAVPATPAVARTYSMIGNVSDLDCDSAPQVTLTLSLAGLDMKLHAADISKVDFLSSAGAPVHTMVCSQLRGITARMQYTLISGGTYDGEIRAITLTALPQ